MGSTTRCSGKRRVSGHSDWRKSKRSKKWSRRRWWEQIRKVVVSTVVRTPGTLTITERRIIRRTWPHRNRAERWVGTTRRPCSRRTRTRSTRFQSARTPSLLSRTPPIKGKRAGVVWIGRTSLSTPAMTCSINLSSRIIIGRLWHLHSHTWKVGVGISRAIISLLRRACALATYSWVEPKIKTSKRYKRWS